MKTLLYFWKNTLYNSYSAVSHWIKIKWFGTGGDTLNSRSYALGMVLSLVSGHWFPGIGFRALVSGHWFPGIGFRDF